MKITNIYTASFLLLLIANSAFAQPSSWSDWQHGYLGHTRALAAAERSNAPLVVYFHADWCGWCRKLNTRYLREGEVRSTLSGMQKVEMEPEKGASENKLFKQYGGSGFPSFHVLVPASGERPVKLSPFKRSGEWLPARFAQAIRDAASGQYNRWAHRLERNGDRDSALEVLDAALEYDSDNAYAFYLQGLIHHKTGHERRDVASLRRAKAAYERALALDPGHRGSRKGLAALRDL